jgi:Mg-chelatase subunit ChlD
MRGPDRGGLREDIRAASEIIGVVLLIGMVFLGAWLVVVYGSSIIDQVQDQNDRETAKLVVQEIDSRLGTLAQLNDVGRVQFDTGNTDPDDMVLRESGSITVIVNQTSTCQAELDLSSIRYEKDDGTTVAYEAGGVWQTARQGSDGSTMVTAPDVSFRNGSLDVTVINVTGTIDESINEAVLNVDSSREDSDEIDTDVTQGACIRPDNITLKVQSDFYRAWGDYLQSEVGSEYDVRTFDGNRTALVYLPQEALPRAADDERNQVVGLNDDAPPDYMSSVTITDNEISVDKDAGNTYRVAMRPLTDDEIGIGRLREVESSRDIYRDPIDVVFVLDDSGSMRAGQGESFSDCDGNRTACQPDKLIQAQRATAGFLPALNSTIDRAAIIGFDGDSEYYPTRSGDGEYLTNEFGSDFQLASQSSGINGSIYELDDGGSTRMDLGLDKAFRVQDLDSNQTRQRIVVLLSDGQNNPSSADSDTKAIADRMDDAGITIYTIGFGGGADEDLLEEVADRTGGEYNFADSQDELEDVFDQIAEDVTSSRTIARDPFTSVTRSEEGDTYSPYVAGDTDSIDTVEQHDKRFININDPTSPSLFRQSFVLEGGEAAVVNASWYGCDEYVGTPFRDELGGQSYVVSRCADINESDVTNLSDNPASDTGIRVYHDGDDLTDDTDSTPADELRNASAPWQTNMTDTLVAANVLEDRSETTVELQSNQALIVYDFPDTPNSVNRLPVLYEIGRSENEARADSVINLRVRNVNITG